jgi:tRNA(Met) C34 N-acetyltransferase TmcA
MKQLQKKIKYGKMGAKEDDPFELFVASTNIRYCYYNETHKILGNTFGMLVLQVNSAFDCLGMIGTLSLHKPPNKGL